MKRKRERETRKVEEEEEEEGDFYSRAFALQFIYDN